jgi:hypothetical protein
MEVTAGSLHRGDRRELRGGTSRLPPHTCLALYYSYVSRVTMIAYRCRIRVRLAGYRYRIRLGGCSVIVFHSLAIHSELHHESKFFAAFVLD